MGARYFSSSSQNNRGDFTESLLDDIGARSFSESLSSSSNMGDSSAAKKQKTITSFSSSVEDDFHEKDNYKEYNNYDDEDNDVNLDVIPDQMFSSTSEALVSQCIYCIFIIIIITTICIYNIHHLLS